MLKQNTVLSGESVTCIEHCCLVTVVGIMLHEGHGIDNTERGFHDHVEKVLLGSCQHVLDSLNLVTSNGDLHREVEGAALNRFIHTHNAVPAGQDVVPTRMNAQLLQNHSIAWLTHRHVPIMLPEGILPLEHLHVGPSNTGSSFLSCTRSLCRGCDG